MLGKILVCFHFLLLEYGIYFTFQSEKLFGCILLAVITFGIFGCRHFSGNSGVAFDGKYSRINYVHVFYSGINGGLYDTVGF